MLHKKVPCSIRTTASQSTRKMWAVVRAKYPLAISVMAEEYCCLDCYQRWGWQDLSDFMAHDKVACSNCYSSRVLIVSIRAEILTEQDMAEIRNA